MRSTLLIITVCSLLSAAATTLHARTASWLTTASGSWNTASNWSTAPNYPGDGADTYDVVISPSGQFYFVFVNGSYTVNSFSMSAGSAAAILNTGNRLTVTGNGTLTAGSLNLSSATLSSGGVFNIASNLAVNTGALTGSGSFSIASNGTAAFSGFSTLNGKLQNAGNLAVGLTLDGNSGTITNGGTLTLYNSNTASSANISGGSLCTLSNSGLINASYTASIRANFTNTGTINVASGGNLTLGRTFNFNAGTIGGSGSVILASDTTMNVGSVGLRSLQTKLSNNGTLMFFNQASMTLASNGVLENLGTVIFQVASTNSSPLINGGINTSLNNYGEIDFLSNGSVSLATPVINNGGQIDSGISRVNITSPALSFFNHSTLSGAGTFAFTDAGTLSNSGYLQVLGPTLFTGGVGTPISNSGTIEFADGVQLFAGKLGGTGTYLIDSGVTFYVPEDNTSVARTLSGQLVNNGTLNLAASAFAIDSGGTLINNNYASLSSYNTGISSATIRNNGTFTLSGSALVTPAFINDSGTIVCNVQSSLHSSTFSGNSTVAGTSTALFGSITNSGTINCTAAHGALFNQTINNNGTFNISDDFNFQLGTFGGSGTYIVGTNGTLTLEAGYSTHALTTKLYNNGTILLSSPLTVSGLLVNSGTMIVLSSAAGITSTVNPVQNLGTFMASGNATSDAAFNNYGTYSYVQGTQTLTKQLYNAYNGTVGVSSNGTLNSGAGLLYNEGTVALNVGGFVSGSMVNNGTITMNLSSGVAEVHGTGGVYVQPLFAEIAGALRQGTLSIGSSASLSINAGDALGTSVVKTLSLGSSARLNLNDHDFILDYAGASPLTSITASLKTGYNAGAWKGVGIDSYTAAAADRALGVAEASAVLGTGGGTFSGQSVDGSAVLIRYTYAGDSNLDGKVDVADLGSLASHWQTAGSWFAGDFNYDGKIDVADLGLLASHWQFGATSPGPSFQEALASVTFSVPEPAAMALILPALLLRRRRRAA